MEKSIEPIEFINQCKKYEHYQFANLEGDPSSFASPFQFWKWIRDKSNLPSLKLNIDFPHKEVLQEVLSVEHKFVKHRGDMHPGWESMCIHGVNTEQTDDWRSPAYEDKGYTEKPLHDWTDIADSCPTMKKWLLETFPMTEFDRVRFMMLRPGGYIQPHQDYDNRSLNAINVALNNPEGCVFAMEEAGCIPWQDGDVRLIDIGRQHCVYNDSDQDRIHIIIHGNQNKEFNNLAIESYLNN